MANYTGIVYEHTPEEIGDITITEGPNYLWLSITKNANEVIKAPLSKDLDVNAIKACIINIVNQCAICTHVVDVDITEV